MPGAEPSTKFPKLGIGGNQFGRRVDVADAKTILAAAIYEGACLVDTAEQYAGGESERVIGEALHQLGRRNEMMIATKFGATSNPVDACEASLRRLKTDRIDLYQMHHPSPDTPIAETLGRLAQLVEQGKVVSIGSSNFAGWQLADANWTAKTLGLPRFVTCQSRYSLLERGAEAEIVPACQRFNVGLIPYYPLGGGLLTGKYQRGVGPPPGTRLATSPIGTHFLTDAMFDRVSNLQAFAAAREIPLLSLAIGGLAAMPSVVSVIVGAVSPEQVHANAEASRWVPTSEDRALLAGLEFNAR